ncbi:hypothetical protein AGMMS49975_04880 [Clostridia bacterium]|nr:hypothetical protein AGMMS49975_04880 [Clostridia bacterium]
MKRKRTTMYRRLTVSLLLVSLVSMLLVTAVSYLLARGVIINESLSKTRNSIIASGQDINAFIESKEKFTETLGRVFETTNDRELIKPQLEGVINLNRDLLDIYVGLDDNFRVSAVYPAPVGYVVTKRGWYITARESDREIIITEPYQDAMTGEMVITLAQNYGKIEGVESVLGMDVELGDMLALVSNMTLPKGGYAFLATETGDIVTHPQESYRPTPNGFINMDSKPMYKQIAESYRLGDRYTKLKDENGETRYIIPHTVSSLGWVLYVSVPQETILEPINSQLWYFAVIYVVLMVLISLFIAFFTRRELKYSLRRLVRAIEDLANGKLTFYVRTNDIKAPTDELGMLYAKFGNMLETLSALLNDLEKMSKKHKEGDHDYKINENRYRGAYLDIVRGVNNMVFMYVEDFRDVLAVFKKFGDGDFDAPVKKYPGKKSIRNVHIENLRNNLKSINNKIIGVTETALEGDLSVFVDTSGQKGSWLHIIENLNKLIQAIVIPLDEATRTLVHISRGRLQTTMAGEYKGDFAALQVAMNKTASQLNCYIGDITATLNAVAKNDMSAKITGDFYGDFDAIKLALNKITGTQSDLLECIEKTASQVRDGAKDISEISGIIADGTKNQNETIGALSGAVGDFTDSVKKTADSANRADTLSKESIKNVQRGTEEMEGMLESINAMKAASNSISQVIAVIEDIASQTNLLAINASVEAARAGVHGKGFAVVAQEVRSLASKSQHSAAETQKLINNAIAKIEDGNILANRTSDALSKVYGDIKDVSLIIAEISDTSKSQEDLTKKIMTQTRGIAAVAKENADALGQSASAAESMSRKSDSLNEIVTNFKKTS